MGWGSVGAGGGYYSSGGGTGRRDSSNKEEIQDICEQIGIKYGLKQLRDLPNLYGTNFGYIFIIGTNRYVITVKNETTRSFIGTSYRYWIEIYKNKKCIKSFSNKKIFKYLDSLKEEYIKLQKKGQTPKSGWWPF